MVSPALGDEAAVLRLLSSIKDPEVPVLNVVEMGIVRRVELGDRETVVQITPTYSGCPAMEVIEGQIRQVLEDSGLPGVRLKRVYAPPWTTDWMTEEARRKLRDYGIAPPARKQELVQLDEEVSAPCPYCHSIETELRSAFGPTACKALHFCRACCQPFESFKTI